MTPNAAGCDVQAPEWRIEIWSAAASADLPGNLERRCQAWLTAEERQRAARFRKLTTRNQHIVGRGMARRLLAMPPVDSPVASPLAPTEIVLGFTTHGKPFVAAPQRLAQPFNVAHTEGMVLFASCPAAAAWPAVAASDAAGSDASALNPAAPDPAAAAMLGVDVEPLSRRTDVALAERYFAAPEVQYVLDHRDAEARLAAFLRVWTLKEALIKAIGTGLTMPLADFAFEGIDDERPRVRMLNPALGSGDCWQFIRFSPAPGYIGALAWHAGPTDRAVAYRLRSFESLLESHD